MKLKCNLLYDFGELGKCPVEIDYDYEPPEENATTDEVLNVTGGSFSYNDSNVQMSKETYSDFEKYCWEDVRLQGLDNK